ncbi:MAG: ABC transporter permease [Candidatus Eisenbacteria bacterium]
MSGMRGVRLPFAPLLRGALLARRGRVVLAVAAIAIGTSVAAALLLVSRDVGAKVTRELRAYGPNLVVAPEAGTLALGPRDLSLGVVGGEARLGAGTRAWLADETAAGRLAGAVALRYAVGQRGTTPAIVDGTDLPALALLYPEWTYMPAGRPGADVDAIAGAAAARELGLVAGDGATLEIAGPRGTRPLGLARIAIARTGGPEDRQVFVRADRLAEALGDDAEGARFHLALARADGATPAILAYASRPLPPAAAGEGATLRAVRQLSAGDGEVMRRLSLLLIAVTVVALGSAILCSMSTLTDLVLERTREIALLRALGAGRRDLVHLFATEALALGAVGGLAGLAVGIVAAQAIGLGVFGTTIRIAPLVPPAIVVLGVATALVASVLPLRRALAIEPAPVLRGE